jgi:hypothetical protein
MGLSSRDMIALIGAHTTGTQQFVDPAEANYTFDTTDTIWDTRFCGFLLPASSSHCENWGDTPLIFRHPDGG